jgi:hypothetical protein
MIRFDATSSAKYCGTAQTVKPSMSSSCWLRANPGHRAPWFLQITLEDDVARAGRYGMT